MLELIDLVIVSSVVGGTGLWMLRRFRRGSACGACTPSAPLVQLRRRR